MASATSPGHRTASPRRMAAGYVGLVSLVVVVVILAIGAGSRQRPAPSVSGVYTVEAGTGCLGERFRLQQSGRFLTLESDAGAAGKLEASGGRVTGQVTCADGGTLPVDLAVARASGGPTLSGASVVASFERPVSEEAAELPDRGAEETFARLMLAIAVVILAARLVGAAVARIGQPRVMGEVLAGILLGPTLLGAIAGGSVTEALFPPDIIPLLTAGADIGLVFYMFLVGLELDLGLLKGRVQQAAFISQAGIATPMATGLAVAVPIYTLVGPQREFLPFALFIGVAMSITAFPVLARILFERRMLKRPLGALVMGAAAVDDITAWALLALATGVAAATGAAQAAHGAGQEGELGSTLAGLLAGDNVGLALVVIIGLAVLFSVAMATVGRRLLARVAVAYDEAGHVPAGWIAAIFVGVLISAYAAGSIPVAPIFGAFVMGMIMPRRADLTHDVSRRLEDFVTTVLLPLFFVTTGLKTQVGLLDRPILWVLTGLLVVVAVFCKWVGAMAAARFTGLPLRDSAVVGALMNTRGLTELIVLNIGLELGLITPALFTMLVIMALATTFMAGPALRLLDPKGRLSAPPEEEFETAAAEEPARGRERAVLVAPQSERNAEALASIAEPLATSEPPRELILARVLLPPRAASGALMNVDRDVAEAAGAMARLRDDLAARRVAARAVAFTSPRPAEDIIRLSAEHPVDVVLLDGRRPLVGEAVPRGDVGTVLLEAECDAAVLIGRDGEVPSLGPDRPVVVPFGGAEHDWAALELGAWLASAREAPMHLLGAAADVEAGERDASRLLANASLVVQQLAGVAAEPVMVRPGREGVMEAAEGSGLLVMGLSDRWREEGLGALRSEIARTARVPVLLVRRGQRPGALASRSDVTRFTWSRAGPGQASR